MLKKFIQIFIFAGFWLCFVPWLVICLKDNVINPDGILEYFIQYTTLFFILILTYWLINRIVDHCYMKHEVKSRVRKITIKQQLERLERGEIDIAEAQNLKTFTKVQKPKTKKGASVKRPTAKGASCKKPKPTEIEELGESKRERKPSGRQVKGRAPSEPVIGELPPAYDEEMAKMVEQ